MSKPEPTADELAKAARLKPYQDVLESELPLGEEAPFTDGFIHMTYTHDHPREEIHLFYVPANNPAPHRHNKPEEVSPEFTEAALILRRVAGYLDGEYRTTEVIKEDWPHRKSLGLGCDVSFPSSVTPEKLKETIALFKEKPAQEIYKDPKERTRVAYAAMRRSLHFGAALTGHPTEREIALAIGLKNFGAKLLTTDEAELEKMLATIEEQIDPLIGRGEKGHPRYVMAFRAMANTIREAFTLDTELPGKDVLTDRICTELADAIIEKNRNDIALISTSLKIGGEAIYRRAMGLEELLGKGRQFGS